MFSRYTEKARRVIFFSRYEASQFGSLKIETEHLLLGLLRADQGVSSLLSPYSMHPEVAGVEARLASLIGRIQRATERRDFLEAKVCLDEAIRENENLKQLSEKHPRSAQGTAGEFSPGQSSPTDDESSSIRKQIEDAVPMRPKISTSIDLPLSQECKRALAYSAEEAEQLKHKYVGPEHLLLGLLREESSFAARILRQRGLELPQLRNSVATSWPPQGRYHV